MAKILQAMREIIPQRVQNKTTKHERTLFLTVRNNFLLTFVLQDIL
jgi:hypothetical protein